MKAKAFLEERRRVWAAKTPPMLTLMATPLLLEDGRVDITDPNIAALLREPPAFRPNHAALAYTTGTVAPTVRGIASVRDRSPA